MLKWRGLASTGPAARGLAATAAVNWFEGYMRHDWVFDVLSDLLAYANQNGLPRLAARVSDAIDEARSEIAASGEEPEEAPQVPPRKGRQIH